MCESPWDGYRPMGWVHAAIPHEWNIWVRKMSCFDGCCYNDLAYDLNCDGWMETDVKVSMEIPIHEDARDEPKNDDQDTSDGEVEEEHAT